jgi:hypothetical protein
LGSLIAEAEEANILTPNEEQSPYTPKIDSLFQLLDVEAKTITTIQKKLMELKVEKA